MSFEIQLNIGKKKYPVIADKNTTVGDLKRMISRASRIPSGRQILIHLDYLIYDDSVKLSTLGFGEKHTQMIEDEHLSKDEIIYLMQNGQPNTIVVYDKHEI